MLLSYRGSYYSTIITQLPKQQDFITAKYRGVSYKIVKHTKVQTQLKSELKYRGVIYISSSK
ncbi:hypothetical protein NIES592_08360 [Fischerella major NIES-592]|uniref:DUF4278 domain-containing protein n=1 Tax=Fischerella major NIES-592 TaxID=210994 RepID=A0A1U7H1N2_9CYAN|nr:hypothetical protein NIES592_08360 [Fischerella major NIES-592]